MYCPENLGLGKIRVKLMEYTPLDVTPVYEDEAYGLDPKDKLFKYAECNGTLKYQEWFLATFKTRSKYSYSCL